MWSMEKSYLDDFVDFVHRNSQRMSVGDADAARGWHAQLETASRGQSCRLFPPWCSGIPLPTISPHTASSKTLTRPQSPCRGCWRWIIDTARPPCPPELMLSCGSTSLGCPLCCSAAEALIIDGIQLTCAPRKKHRSYGFPGK
jgi:hypothetical protein